MNIDYVLLAHGIGRKGGGSKVSYESVANLSSQSINNGAEIFVTWNNPTIDEFVKVELFASESDLTNLDYEQTIAIATKVVDGSEESYTHPATIGVTYYFKAFVTYYTFGNNVISRGATTSITASDKTPPAPITDFVASGDDQSVKLSWSNPTDVDFSKVKIVFKTDDYPTSHTDGLVAYEGSATSATVTGLTNEVEYFFRAFTFDTNNNVNDDGSQQVTSTPADVKIYGVKIDTTNSNPFTAVTYTESAIGMTPAPPGSGASDWDNVYPFNQIRPVLLKNGQVVGELQKNDFSKFLDGSSANISNYDSGDVMIEFPKIYWKFERIGTDLYVKYADRQIDNTWKCLAHARGSNEKEFVYIGAFLGSSDPTKLRSVHGKTVDTNLTIGTFRTRAELNGVGYQQMGYFQLLMLQILFLIRYKNLDSQTALGRGFVDGNSSKVTTGTTFNKGMYFGETTGKHQMKFAGIEDFWGNCFYWIDGLFIDSSRNILISTENFNNTGSGYVNYGQGATTNLSGFINDIQGGTESGFIVKNTTGSTTTYYSDYGYLNASCFPDFGGHRTAAEYAGAFALRVVYSASSAESTLGARLCYL